jgi:peptidoglycan/LPS O-acetylase OafA/YrhL
MAIAIRGTRPAEGKPAQTKRQLGRGDIQGLRAIAVVVVILDHLISWPSGGFVGVDVFFVISGFLITGQLLKEHDRTGSISFVGFYKRRIKRIIPASTLVLIVTATVAFYVFNLGRAIQTFGDAVWALAFSGNWRFALSGIDYFQAEGAVSPLQHFWSLAVEEQFYFVWPWMLALVLIFAGGASVTSAARTRRVAGIAMGIIILASFAWALYESVSSPTLAYFSTFSRAWELGLGALLAVVASKFTHIPSWLRPALGWIGLIGIIVSIFVVNDGLAFPAPWALLPVLSTGLVILAGTGGAQRFLWPLTNPVSRYIGDISYSLYLWHFPVIVFLGVFFPDGGTIYLSLCIVIMFVVASVSYHQVENRIRDSDWLSVSPVNGSTPRMRPKARRALARQQAQGNRGSKTRAGQFIGLATLLLIVACLVPLAVKLSSPPVEAVGLIEFPDDATAAPGEEKAPVVASLSNEIDASLSLGSWPALTPPIEELGRASLVPEWVEDGCLANEQGSKADPYENAAGCIYGDPDSSNQAVLLGDSVGISWMPAIRAALGDGWAIHVITMMQCPVADVTVLKNDRSPFPACNEFREWSNGQVAEIAPDLLILANADSLGRIVDVPDREAALNVWSEGMTSRLAAVVPLASKTVVLSPPPIGEDLKSCVTPFNKPSDCSTGLGQGYKNLAQSDRDSVDAVANEKLTYFDTRNWFCDSSSRCAAIIGTTPVRADGAHLTRNYSGTLGPVMATVLLSQPAASEEG